MIGAGLVAFVMALSGADLPSSTENHPREKSVAGGAFAKRGGEQMLRPPAFDLLSMDAPERLPFPAPPAVLPLAAVRYRGTTVTPNPKLGLDERLSKSLVNIFEKADWIPFERSAHFSIYREPDLTCTHWSLGIVTVVPNTTGHLVTLHATPQFTSKSEGGLFLPFDHFVETYQVVGDRFVFVSGRPGGNRLRGSIARY